MAVKKTMLCLAIVAAISLFAAESIRAESNNYYLIMKSGADAALTLEVGEQTGDTRILSEEELSNLKLSEEIPVQECLSLQKESLDEDTLLGTVRSWLLYYGYATLIDEATATDEELAAQRNAEVNALGVWGLEATPDTIRAEESAESSETVSRSEEEKGHLDVWQILRNLIAWIAETLGVTVPNFVFNIIILLILIPLVRMIIKLIIKQKRTIKANLILAGVSESGKTSLYNYYEYGRASSRDLLDTLPTKEGSEAKSEPIEKDKKILKLRVVDTPGNQLSCVIDELNRRRIGKASGNTYILLVLAATKKKSGNGDYDNKFIQEQKQYIESYLAPILKAKTICRPRAVIVFIAKSDLYYDENGLKAKFDPHIKALKKLLPGTDRVIGPIAGSMADRSGTGPLENKLFHTK